MSLRINQEAPDFTAKGPPMARSAFHEWLGESGLPSSRTEGLHARVHDRAGRPRPIERDFERRGSS